MEPPEPPRPIVKWFRNATQTLALKAKYMVDRWVALSSPDGDEDVPLVGAGDATSEVSEVARPKSTSVVRMSVGLSIPTYVQPMQDVIGYKTVAVRTRKGSIAQARLRLRIPFNSASIYAAGSTHNIESPADLKRSKKYCTSHAFVEAAEILAESPGLLKTALLALQTGYAELRSLYDTSFNYPLRGYVNEPRAGNGNGHCGSGIYFYLNEGGTYAYSKAEPSWVISGIVNKTLMFSKKPGETEGEDEEDSPEAIERRISELRKWASEQIEGKVDLV
jgi:hypothetical protein